ncbi:hypothetical protein [Perlucidibaca aquatica]|jgi:hypothetical protein|uniref:hypothetical protein n=1 Tax=Perlucidibaca aquatica TaxID=1852776 RepID=UPI00083AD53A|nr:hypothetical protein [Perlucidibaca aquatica]
MADLRSKIKLLSSQPLPIALLATLFLPLTFGAVTGLALGWSIPAYVFLLILSVFGGVMAGYEHLTPITGFCRGACGATFFTTGVLGTHIAVGNPALVPLPEPLWILPVLNIIGGSLFGALGGWLRGKAEFVAAQ